MAQDISLLMLQEELNLIYLTPEPCLSKSGALEIGWDPQDNPF